MSTSGRSPFVRRLAFVERRQHGDVGAAELAGELHRAVGANDGARVDERVRDVELIGALDEERPLAPA